MEVHHAGLDPYPGVIYHAGGWERRHAHGVESDVAPRMRWFFDWLGRRVDRLEKIHPVGEGGYILKWRVTRYRGPRLVLQDGTVVERGDSVGELHFDNQRATALPAERRGFPFRHEFIRVLAALGRELRTQPEYRAVSAIHGSTLFWRAASAGKQVGFESIPVSPFTRWWLGTWQRILLAQYHPEGWRRLRQGRRTELRNLWISRRALLRLADEESHQVRDSAPDA
jgi:hypothetical protein